jgi:hypothetical protein
MPEQDPHGDDPSLQAPPKLVEALKRLQQQSGIQVPPQIDEAALSQARLHLSHVQQLKEREGPRRLTAEELVLAARSESSAKPWSQKFGAGSPGPRSRNEPSRIPWRKILAWAIALALVAGLLALLLPWHWTPHGASPAIRQPVFHR